MEISQLVGTTVVEFIDYSFMIVVVLLIYYGFRFFTLGKSNKNGVSPWKKNYGSNREAYKKYKEKNKETAEKKRKEKDFQKGFSKEQDG